MGKGIIHPELTKRLLIPPNYSWKRTACLTTRIGNLFRRVVCRNPKRPNSPATDDLTLVLSRHANTVSSTAHPPRWPTWPGLSVMTKPIYQLGLPLQEGGQYNEDQGQCCVNQTSSQLKWVSSRSAQEHKRTSRTVKIRYMHKCGSEQDNTNTRRCKPLLKTTSMQYNKVIL